jgi:SAM-dependent methyltransferase
MDAVTKHECPLTGKANTRVKRFIKTNLIIEAYKKNLSIDVTKYFNNILEIPEVECLDTGYIFYPYHQISGDSNFYEQLENNSWYYQPWKWEHAKSLSLIPSNKLVLEIGCGEGSFLEKVKKAKSCKCVGLELNTSAVNKGRSNGLDLRNQLIENFSTQNEEKFDIVCSFHVLEHIYSIKPFLSQMVKCLKPKGKLIIAVPNNDSFLKLDPNNCLNLPPHHMGRWTKKSLSSITKYFPLSIENIFFEKLQNYHLDYYKSVLRKHILKKFKTNIGLFDKVINKLFYIYNDNIFIKRAEKKLIQKLPNLKSFSILIELKKSQD